MLSLSTGVRETNFCVYKEAQGFRDNNPGRDGYVAYIRDPEDNVIGLRSMDAIETEHHLSHLGRDIFTAM